MHRILAFKDSSARCAWAPLAAVLLAGCHAHQAEVKPDSGREIYRTRCAVCHGDNGEGRPGLYPPLTAQWVKGPPERLAAIILDGMQGPMGNCNAVMPGWGRYMRDAEIAAVMTWLRKSPVTPVEVTHIRIETDARNSFWTADDLNNLHIR